MQNQQHPNISNIIQENIDSIGKFGLGILILVLLYDIREVISDAITRIMEISIW